MKTLLLLACFVLCGCKVTQVEYPLPNGKTVVFKDSRFMMRSAATGEITIGSNGVARVSLDAKSQAQDEATERTLGMLLGVWLKSQVPAPSK